MPVIEHYTKEHKVSTVRRLCFFCYAPGLTPWFKIDATASIDEVHEKAKVVVTDLFAGKIADNVTV